MPNTTRGFRTFAIIPAAGRSRRMGAAKLLLEVGGAPIIEVVARAWLDSTVYRVVVVAREQDESLVDRCRRLGADVVATRSDPAEMRDTIEIGLDYVESRYNPEATDAWLVTPADIPGITRESIDTLISAYSVLAPRVLVPWVNAKRGHPVVLPWWSVAAFRASPRDQGLDAFVRRSDPQLVRFDDHGLVMDVDTPEDYRRVAQDLNPY